MSEMSPQLSRLTGEIFTFGGIAFGIKILPLTSMTYADVNIPLDKKGVAVGMLAVLTAYLLITALAVSTRDALQRRIRDRISAEQNGGPSQQPESATDSWLFRAQNHLALFSIVTGLLDSVFPAIFGVLVVLVCIPEINEFFTQLSHVLGVDGASR